MTDEVFTFEEAINRAQMLRECGFVGISVFHKHDYAALEAEEACYVVYAYTKAELAEMRIEAEKEEDPIDPFEITQWTMDEYGNTCGQQLFASETLAELVQQAQKHLEHTGIES